MNTLKLIAGVALFFAAASCADDDNSVSVNGNATAVANNLKSGTWRVTSYIDSGEDETAYFTGYDFDFNTDGSVTATNGTNTYTGSWVVTDDDLYDDNSDDDNVSDIDFDLAFATPDYFAELTDDWEVIERSGRKVVLMDDNDDGNADYLTFEKN